MMNVVNFLARRGAGFDRISSYDGPLCRLKSYRDDGYEDMLERDLPPLTAYDFCTAPGYENFIALGNVGGKFLHDTNKVTDTPEESPFVYLGESKGRTASISWIPGETKFVAISHGDDAELWDVSRSVPYKMRGFNGIDGGATAKPRRLVNTASFHPRDKAILATGDYDGSIALWDIRANGESPSSMMKTWCDHGPKSNSLGVGLKNPICDLVFLDDFSLYTCCRGDSAIKVWDMRMYGAENVADPRPELTLSANDGKPPNGYAQLLTSRDGRLYAVQTSGTIDEFNIASHETVPVATFTSPSRSEMHLCLSPDGQYLLSGSSRAGAYIWSTKKPGYPMIKLRANTGWNFYEYVHWSNIREEKIVMYGDGDAYRFWRIGSAEESEADSDLVVGRAEIIESPNKERIPASENP